jgi:hypothetical protein
MTKLDWSRGAAPRGAVYGTNEKRKREMRARTEPMVAAFLAKRKAALAYDHQPPPWPYPYTLTCRSCEHEATVELGPEQIERGRFKCSACGSLDIAKAYAR